MRPVALRQQIGRHPAVCTLHGTDCYGRALGLGQEATGTDLNGRLVAQSWALASRRSSTPSVPQEEHAQVVKSDSWAGEFAPPWNWRRGDRLD